MFTIGQHDLKLRQYDICDITASILNAIAEQNLTSIDEIGVALSAGTNCGSCRPELMGLLDLSTSQIAAE